MAAKRTNARATTSAARSAVGVDLDDAAFQAGLRDAVRRMTLRAESDLVRLGTTVQNEARKLCPVDTGRLRSSIMASGLQHDSRGAYVRVGTNVHYAGHVEFGTRYSPAQPYMRPALLQSKAGDLNYSGGEPKRHGVVQIITTRRSRRRSS